MAPVTSSNLHPIFAALAAWTEALDDERRLYSQKETAAILGVTVQTIHRWRKAGLLGYILMPGGDVRYRWSHIEEFLFDHERPTKAELVRRKARSLAA